MDRSKVAISVEGLAVRYPRRWRSPAVDALVDLDLEVAAGEIVGVLGPNGSGKTTLFKALSGSLAPLSGRARVLGLAPGDRKLTRLMGYQPEGPLPFPQLSAREFLRYLGALMDLPPADVERRGAALCERMQLEHAGRRPIGTYSTGMQKRLMLATALLAEPAVLLLDEPTSGLDPLGSLLVMEILESLARDGRAVLMASHHLQEVEHLCHRVCLLERGRKVAEGSLDELLGTGEIELQLRGVDDAGRRELEAAAVTVGAEVVGWRRARRHLFELFRDLPAR